MAASRSPYTQFAASCAIRARSKVRLSQADVLRCAELRPSACALCISCPGCEHAVTGAYLTRVVLAVACIIASLVAAERRARGARATAAARAAPPPLRILSNPQLPWAIAHWETQRLIDAATRDAILASLPAASSSFGGLAAALGVVALVVAIFESGASPTLAAAVFSVFEALFGLAAFGKAAAVHALALLCTPRVASSGGGGVVECARAALLVAAVGLVASCGVDVTDAHGHALWWLVTGAAAACVFAAARLARGARPEARGGWVNLAAIYAACFAIGAIHNGRAIGNAAVLALFSAASLGAGLWLEDKPFAVLGALCAVGAGLIETWRFPRVGGLNVALRLALACGVMAALLARRREPVVRAAADALAAVALAFLWAVSVIGNSGDPEEWWALVDGSGAARYSQRWKLLPWSAPFLGVGLALERCRRSPAIVPTVAVGVFTTASVHLLQVLSWSSYFLTLACVAAAAARAQRR